MREKFAGIIIGIIYISCIESVAVAGSIKKKSCSEQQITMLSFGDYLLHGRLQQYALSNNDFSIFLKKVNPVFEYVDFRTLNLEGPVANGVLSSGKSASLVNYYDNRVLSSYPMFNYHQKAVIAIKDLGFDLVTTANNHALDRRALGIDKTITTLKENELDYVGTRLSEQKKLSDFIRIQKINSFKVAFIACTEHTNGISDKEEQVLYCGKDLDKILSLIKGLKSSGQVDGIFIFPHWGEENETKPRQQHRILAKNWIEEGATAIIGSHPHVVQTMETMLASDGRLGFVFYSLGNFVSGQVKPLQKVTVGLLLKLQKNQHNLLEVVKVAYIPMVMNGQTFDLIPLSSELKYQSIAMNSADQYLSQNLGKKNKMYFEEAVQALQNCEF
ncbi:MAG: CapA family protein [Bdellovibrionaceae bacterium]|nr:CapA family protein [Pseudobdellovibrionaceae bacterium]NUM57877.1 CapA family protein [Pseudobdellovibrionaceae bacterium]